MIVDNSVCSLGFSGIAARYSTGAGYQGGKGKLY